MRDVVEVPSRPSASYAWVHSVINDPTGVQQTKALALFKLRNHFRQEAALDRQETILWLQFIARDNIQYILRARQDAILQAIMRCENWVRDMQVKLKSDRPLPRAARVAYSVVMIVLIVYSVARILWAFL